MVDRRNHLRWALVALGLGAAGVAGVAGSLVSFDLMPRVGADTPLLPDTAVARWRQAEDWRLAALATLGLLLASYGWRVLAAQLRRAAAAQPWMISSSPLRAATATARWCVVRRWPTASRTTWSV